jgi:hypothetical protein
MMKIPIHTITATGHFLRFRNLPANHQIAALKADHTRWNQFVPSRIVPLMGFAGGLILSCVALLLLYLYGKLNDAKLTKVPPEVRAQASADFSPENIRLTAARLKQSPLQINNRLPPRTGRRYIVVGGVSEGSCLDVAPLTFLLIVRFFGGLDRKPLVDPRGKSEEHSYFGH